MVSRENCAATAQLLCMLDQKDRGGSSVWSVFTFCSNCKYYSSKFLTLSKSKWKGNMKGAQLTGQHNSLTHYLIRLLQARPPDWRATCLNTPDHYHQKNKEKKVNSSFSGVCLSGVVTEIRKEEAVPAFHTISHSLFSQSHFMRANICCPSRQEYRKQTFK